MEEFPSQSHKAQEQRPREVQPVTLSPGRVRKAPVGRRFLETFFLGDIRSAFSGMIWNTFFPNLRENFTDAMHDGVDSLFNGTEGGFRPGSRRYRGSNSQISKHNPDRALGGRGAPEPRMTREDRAQQNTSVIEIGSRAEAEEVLAAMNQTLDQFDSVSLAEFYQLVRMTPEHTDYKFGWEELGGAKIAHSRGAYYLNLPPVIALR